LIAHDAHNPSFKFSNYDEAYDEYPDLSQREAAKQRYMRARYDDFYEDDDDESLFYREKGATNDGRNRNRSNSLDQDMVPFNSPKKGLSPEPLRTKRANDYGPRTYSPDLRSLDPRAHSPSGNSVYSKILRHYGDPSTEGRPSIDSRPSSESRLEDVTGMFPTPPQATILNGRLGNIRHR
jgi:hypothetical protein